MAHVIQKSNPYCSRDHCCDHTAMSSFFQREEWHGIGRIDIHSKLLIPFIVFFHCFSVCSATFTNEIQPIMWPWYLGKSWVTRAIPRIQYKVSGCSDMCCKLPSVPLCCSFLVFSLLTGCIDHCWVSAGSLTLLSCVPSHKSPCSGLGHDAEIPPEIMVLVQWLLSVLSDRASAEHNVRRLKEPRTAQSWAFLVWEHKEWTVRPVLPKPIKSGNCLLTWGSWWVSMTLHLWPIYVTLLQIIFSLVMETHCRFPQDA